MFLVKGFFETNVCLCDMKYCIFIEMYSEKGFLKTSSLSLLTYVLSFHSSVDQTLTLK